MFRSSRLLRAVRPARATNAAFRPAMLHTMTPLRNATATPPASNDKTAMEGVLEQYGLMPFLGLGAAALISKEVFVVNEEFLLAVDVCAFVFTAYTVGGDTFNKMVADSNTARKEKFDSAFDAAIAAVETYKTSQSLLSKEVDVMKEYAKEHQEACESHARFLTLKPQHDARAEVLAKLESIAAREASEESTFHKELVEDTIWNVTAEIEESQGIRDEIFASALAQLGSGSPLAEDKDVIKRLIMAEMDKQAEAEDDEE